jgi:hypothetical protein
MYIKSVRVYTSLCFNFTVFDTGGALRNKVVLGLRSVYRVTVDTGCCQRFRNSAGPAKSSKQLEFWHCTWYRRCIGRGPVGSPDFHGSTVDQSRARICCHVG